MKIHPFFKSLFLILLSFIFLIVNKDNFITDGMKINSEGQPHFTESVTLLFYLGVPFIISLAYSSPFLFLQKIKVIGFFKLGSIIFIFLTSFMYILEPNDKMTSDIIDNFNEIVYIFHPDINFSLLLILIALPLSVFFITSFFFSSNYKLLLFLFAAFPFALLFSFFSIENLGLILLPMIPNLVSNLYLIKYANENFVLDDENILDTPNL